MIKSFKHKGLEIFYTTGSTKGIQAMHKKRLSFILNYLDEAESIDNMNLTTFKLHKLKGAMQDLWSVTVQANWRITFKFINGNAYIVDYQDYH